MVEANKIIQRDRKENWKVKGLEWEQLRAGETITREMEQALYAALWKLKAYEETGLSPNEIVAMMELVGVGIPQPVADHIAKELQVGGVVPMERSRLENFRANKEEIEYLEGKEQTPYYTQRLEDLRIEQAEVEAWIRSIPNRRARHLCELRYIDGMSLDKIAKRVHLDRSTVGKIITKAIFSHHSP